MTSQWFKSTPGPIRIDSIRARGEVLSMTMKKTVLICLLLFIVMGVAGTRKGRLIGKIVDPEGNPIEGVTVKATSEDVPGFDETEITDAKGVFKVDFDIIEVVYKYRFSKAGFVTLITEQTWRKDGTERVTFVLTPGESAAIGEDVVVTTSEAAAAYQAAVKAFESKDFATAEVKLEEALIEDPELRQGWEALSVVELEQGHYGEAAEAAEKAIELGSTDVAVLKTGGNPIACRETRPRPPRRPPI